MKSRLIGLVLLIILGILFLILNISIINNSILSIIIFIVFISIIIYLIMSPYLILKIIGGAFPLTIVNYYPLILIQSFISDKFYYIASNNYERYHGLIRVLPTTLGWSILLLMGILELSLIFWFKNRRKAKQQPIQN